MGDVAAEKCGWALEGASGELCAGGLTGRVDVSHPDCGLRELDVLGRRLVGQWFEVRRDEGTTLRASSTTGERSWPLAVAEAYVRGADLVASYEAASDWPYSPQIYWRAGQLDAVHKVVGSLSLLVSVQTHLLDTFPRIVAESELRAESALHLTASDGKQVEPAPIDREFTVQASTGVCCVLRRLAGATLSYAEFMPASDFRTVHVWRDYDGNCRLQWQLFAEFLEKGVIRRARVYGVFLRREHDVDTAVACCEAIARESLPLTA